MIGGEDILLRGRPRPDDGDSIVRFLSHAWPDALLEDAAGSEDMPVRPLRDPLQLPVPAEFFVYRDEQSFRSWQQEGAADDNGEDMIHVLIGSREITCVVDRGDSWSGRLVRKLLAALEWKRHQIVEPPAWERKRRHESRRARAA